MKEEVSLHLEWLIAKTDQQLLEYKTGVGNLIENYASLPNPFSHDVGQACFITEYLARTTDFDQALEFINNLNNKEPTEAFYITKLEFLVRHDREIELEAYVQTLRQKKIVDPMIPLICLTYHSGRGKHLHAESFLSDIICNYPRSAHLFRAINLATIFKLDFDPSAFKRTVPWGEKFLALEEKITDSGESATPLIVNYLNLDNAQKRMARCINLYRDNTELHRIPGISGIALPNCLLDRITINPALYKTAIGCTLSHISAWEKIAENKESDPLEIIVEDDGLPLWVNPASCDTARKLMKSQDLDILFVQDCATPLEFCIREFHPGWKPEALPFQTALDRFLQHGQKNLPPGWGLYGYFLSPRGAQKLLALLKRDGFVDHIDWQTFLYSVSDWNHPVVRTKQNIATNYQEITGRMPQQELNSGILNFPMIVHIDFSQPGR